MLSPPDKFVRVKYYVPEGSNEQKETLAGALVIDVNGLCPEVDTRLNPNLFKSLFGIEFVCEAHRHIRSISQFEVTRCFNLRDNISYRLSHPSNILHLDAGIPGRTSLWIFQQVLDSLVSIRDANVDGLDPSDDRPQEDPLTSQFSVAQSFVNGTITTRLPDRDRWIKEIAEDEELVQISQMVWNPAMITKQNMQQVNYNYRYALRNSLILIEDGFLIYREPLVGGESYT